MNNNYRMNERIDRKNDENLYQPKIHSERIRELYLLKQISGLPMTVLVDTAIKEFIANHQISEAVFQDLRQFHSGLTDLQYGWIYQTEELDNI